MTKWLDANTLVTDGHVLRVDAGDTLGFGRAGGYEPFETHIVESLIGEGATVIDGGANAGWYTLRLARAVGPRGRVIAFEPMPRTVRLLEHNLRVNGYRNVTVVPKALAASSGSRRLFLSAVNEGDHRLHDDESGREAIDIEAVTLDELLGDHPDPISLIKLDIQGAEVQALEGMRRTLDRHPETWLATEFWPIGLRRAGSSAREFLDRLRVLGSAIVRIDEARSRLVLLDEEWLNNSVTEALENHVNLLVVPRGWTQLRDLPFSASWLRSHSPTPRKAEIPMSTPVRPRALLIADAAAASGPAAELIRDPRPLRDALATHGFDVDISSAAITVAKGYDVVHVFNTGTPADAARQLDRARSFGRPLVFSPLASIDADADRQAALRDLSARADQLVVFSERELTALHRADALKVPYSFVHYGIDPNWTSGATGDAFRLRSGVRAYALCAGMTSARALELARALRGTDIDLVRLAGTEARKPGEAADTASIAIASDAGVRVIELRADDPLVVSAFAGARAFIDASDDAAPCAAMRAAAAGLPLILNEHSCAREYLGPLASYCETANNDVLRDRLVAVWAEETATRTSQAREERQAAARAWIERALSWNHAARELALAYACVLDAKAEAGKPRVARPAPRKLEIGSGFTPQRGYEHLDARADLPDIDHVADTRLALPFPDATFDELMSRSCIEHVSWREVQSVVREWGRIVKPGGIIDIYTPDFEYLCRRYLARKDDRHLDAALVADAGTCLNGYDDPAWAIIKMFGGQEYPENFHGAVMDEEVLTRVLEGAGFERIERCEPFYSLRLKARRLPSFAHKAASGPATRPPRVEEVVPQVTWDGPIFNFGGYAALARHTVRGLVADGVSVQVTTRDDEPKVREASMASREAWLWQRVLRRKGRPQVHVSCYTPADWQGASIFDRRRAENPGYQAYVGLSMFETDRLPDNWAKACATLDEVWVPSRHSRDLFTQAGVPAHKLQVLPIGIDASRYDPARVEPLPIPGRRRFMFLSVFDWTLRKGWDVLIEAYARAFRASDDVCLVLRTASRSPQDRPSDAINAVFDRLGIDRRERPTVIVLDAPVAEDDMPRLYRAADAFVLPTRGEGWGLPLMEAMASGLPTIATGWGGHLDFMHAGNSFLIDIDGLVPVAEEQVRRSPFYAGAHRWAQPSISHAAMIMRQVFDDPAQARRLGQAAREEIKASWSPRRTSGWITDRIGRLAPDPAVALEKGKAAEAAGRFDEALAFYAQAMRRPGWLLPRYNRASLLKRTQRLPEAIRLFTDLARNGDPGMQAGALFHLTEIAFAAGHIDEAYEHVNACVARNPKHEGGLAWQAFITGRLRERAGDLAGAEQAYADACARKAGWVLATYNLASACRRLGQVDRARRLFGEVALTATDPALRGGSHFHLAQLLEAEGFFDEAVEHAEACKRDLPAHNAAGALRERLLARK